MWRRWSQVLVSTLAVLFPGVAAAHLVVDVSVAVRAPAFAPRSSAVSYKIDVTGLAADNAYGEVMTDQLAPGMHFSSVTSTQGWSCSQSGGKVTCSAETVGPGVGTITVNATAPGTLGPITNTASLVSLGSIDPNADNDTSSAQTILYDPAACSGAAAALLAPEEQTTIADGNASLSWSAVPGAIRYRVWIGVEGARPSVAGETTDTQLTVDAEAGWNEWWVEAVPSGCPTTTSAHRHFFSQGHPFRLYLSDYAGQPGVSGVADGDQSAATFVSPIALGLDPRGTMYVADMGASTVRRIFKGVVATISGQAGNPGSSDGPADNGLLNHPRALTVSPDGNYIFIADTGNHAVRLLYPNGNGIFFGPILFTLAGLPGVQGTTDGDSGKDRFTAPGGITMNASYNLYVGDSGTDRVREVTQLLQPMVTSVAGVAASAGMIDGPAGTARFNGPSGIALDANGNVFVADTGNNVIRRIGIDGVVTTVAGAPGSPGFADGVGAAARFNGPTSLVFDSLGNLYVADTGNHAVRRIAPSYSVTTIIGTGTAGHRNGAGLTAQLNSPGGLAFDTAGTLYIADTGNNVIRVATTTAPPVIARRRAAKH